MTDTTTKTIRKHGPKLPPMTRTEGQFTILGRVEDGKMKPLLNLRMFETRDEAEAECARYALIDRKVDFLVFQLVTEINRA